MGARTEKVNLPPIKMDSVSVPERSKYGTIGYTQKTHTDLRADPMYQRESEKFLTWLGENQGAYEKITGGLVSSDMFETLRDEEGRLGTAVDRARIMRDAPKDIQETYKYLSEEFVASKAGGFGEILKATWDRGVDMIADPINLTFAFVAPGIGNAATKASTAAAQKVLTSSAGKAAANKTIRNVAAANTGKAAAFEGGAWTGIENYYRQDKNISLGIQDTFSKGDFALSTGAGFVLGGGIGYGLSKAFGSTPGLIDNVNDSSKVVPKRKISFDDPETPKPTKIEHRKFTPRTKDAPATETVETTTINWGPVLDNGKPRVRPDGTPVFATSRKDKDGNFLSIDIDDVAIREAFDSKPWTTSKVKGVTPLKENDIQSPEEWIMFNLFHERNHASFSKGNTPTAIYENGANIAALKDLKIWRESQEIEELVPFTAGAANFNKTQSKINATLSATFDKVKLDTNKITGASFYNRLLNPEVDNSLLNKLTRGTRKGADSAIIMLPEADAANLILAFKDIVIKAGADGDSELTLNVIAPKIKEAIRGYGFNDEQLTYLVKEVGEAYGPPPKTRPSSVNIDEDELIYARLSEKNMLDLSNQLANDVGGSSQNTGSMLFDEVANINADGSLTPLQVKNSIASRVLASTQKYLSTSIGGFLKAPNILAPAKRFAPNTISALQKLFSSEMGQSWRRGSVALRGDDFGTYANQRFGTWHTTWRTAYDGIKTTTRGKQREEIDTLISDAVRKNSMAGLTNVEFATPEAKQAVVDSIKVLQRQLREIGKEGEAKGLLQNLAGNYLPRLWLRDNIVANKDKFVDLVISPRGVKGFTTREEGTAFVNELLEIKNQFGNEFGGAGNSFFSNRKIEVVDETLFNDFLDTDLDRIMTGYFSSASKTIAKKDILGVRNLEEFNQIWLPAIEKEMKLNGADGADILQAKKNASYLYRNITGESMERYGPRTQNAIELYMLANRLALLPLSTLSSLTEIFINMSKAGVGTSMRGFRDAAMGGSKRMYDDSMDVLMKTHKMSRAEARKELNELGIALDQAASDSIERLSGDQLSNATMRKISNGFFKLTLLEQWTKTVQLSSYIVGKRLITENIENLASKTALINKGQISKRMQRQIDELADFGIDYKDGIKWYDAGAKLDDAFYAKVKKGGGIYTNEVILNPSSQSGLKPTFMSNPKTSVFGQLLGYPAAFTNTVLKGMIKQTVRDPQTFFTQHVPAAAMMTGIAAFTNGVRSDGKSWEDKEGFEIAIDGIIRWGGNGVLADMVKRGGESAQYYQEPLAYFTGAGVVAGDAYNLVRQGDLFTFLGGKIPGTGAINAILGPFESTENFAEDFRDFTQDLDRSMADFVVRDREAKGGVVDDVAQVTEEPDERIDRMTGLPYNLQAGGAFIDEEDRQEFVSGGIPRAIVKGGTSLIKDLWHASPHNVDKLRADKSIDSNSLSLGRGVATTKQKGSAEYYLESEPSSSLTTKQKEALQERTNRGSSNPTLYELAANVDENILIRTGTTLEDQPPAVNVAILAIAKDYGIELSAKDKKSKRIFYILKKKIEENENIPLTAETIFYNYGIKGAKRDLRETSLEGLSLGGDEEYSFYDDEVLEIISKTHKASGPRNLIKGGRSLIKKAKESGMEVDRVGYHGTGSQWAKEGTTFDNKYFLDNFMDSDTPESHMVYIGLDDSIASGYAQKRWNSEAEAADRAAGGKLKEVYWEDPDIIPLFLKGPGLKLNVGKWSPSTYKPNKHESPEQGAMPWGKWFRQDAMEQLNIQAPATKKSDQIKQIWKEAKKQGYGYIELIGVEDVSGTTGVTTQTQIVPLSPANVKSIYAKYDPDATEEELARNLFSAQGGYIRT